MQYPPPLAAVFALHAFNTDGAPIQLQGTMQRQGEQTLVRVRGEVEQLSLAPFNSYLVPHLGYRRAGTTDLPVLAFRPANPLSDAGFTVV